MTRLIKVTYVLLSDNLWFKFLITELEEMLQMKKRKPRKKKQPLDMSSVEKEIKVTII